MTLKVRLQCMSTLQWVIVNLLLCTFIHSTIAQFNSNSTCNLALIDMGNNITANHFLMRDATGKGLFAVNVAGKVIIDGGMWDQCLRVSNNESNYFILKSDIGEQVLDNLTLPLAIGACLPSLCTANDLEDLGWIAISRAGIDLPFPMILGALSVSEYHRVNYLELSNMIALLIIALLFFLVIIGTIVDAVIRSRLFESVIEGTAYDNIYFNLPYIHYQDEEDDILSDSPQNMTKSSAKFAFAPKSKFLSTLHNSPTNSNELEILNYPEKDIMDIPQSQKYILTIVKIMISWSMITNFKKLFQRNVSATHQRFEFFHGLRVLSIIWIIFGLTCINLTIMGWFNVEHLAETEEDFFYQLAVNSAVYGVDIFFMMSGLLSAYYAVEVMKEKPPPHPGFRSAFTSDDYPQFINPLLIFVRRVVRLAPSLVVAVIFYYKVSIYLGNGPYWNAYVDRITDQCSQYWWASVFFLSSFYPDYSLDEYEPIWGCVNWSWYLSCELIFTVVLLPILFLFYKKRWAGIWICVLLGISSIFTGFLIAYFMNLSVGFGDQPEGTNVEGYANLYYDKPYTRAPAYLLGVIIAFTLQIHPSFRIPVVIRGVAYCIIWVVLAFLYFITFTAYKYSWEEWMNILFVAFAHPVFSICCAIFILLMACGYEGPLNLRKFLSSSLWVPYSRVTYGVYLYSPMIIQMSYASVQVGMSYSLFEVFFLFFAFVIVSYIAGLLNYLVIEAPIITLYDIVIHKKR